MIYNGIDTNVRVRTTFQRIYLKTDIERADDSIKNNFQMTQTKMRKERKVRTKQNKAYEKELTSALATI